MADVTPPTSITLPTPPVPAQPDPPHQLETCTECGQTDDHPKHHFMAVEVQIPQFGGDNVAHVIPGPIRHMDCCPCDTCAVHAPFIAGKKGDALRAYLVSAPDDLSSALEAAGIDRGRG